LGEFPRSQIHISFYEDLQRAPEKFLSELLAFLGVDRSFRADVAHRHHEPRISSLTDAAYFLKKWRIWPYLRNIAPRPLGPRLRSLMLRPRSSLKMEPADRALLTDYYRDDIKKLAALLDRDLSAWLDSSTPALHTLTEHRIPTA